VHCDKHPLQWISVLFEEYFKTNAWTSTKGKPTRERCSAGNWGSLVWCQPGISDVSDSLQLITAAIWCSQISDPVSAGNTITIDESRTRPFLWGIQGRRFSIRAMKSLGNELEECKFFQIFWACKSMVFLVIYFRTQLKSNPLQE